MTNAQTKVILVFIHAGGASKTSTVRDLGYELSRRGQRVLLIDLDPQANLTEWLGIDNVSAEQTVKNALERYEPLPQPLNAHGMDIIPSHIDLAYTDVSIAGLPNPEGRLKVAIDQLREAGTYDYILIDSPPSLGKLSANGGNAADWVLIPLIPKPKGMSALQGANAMIQNYAFTNSRLRTAYMVTQMDSTAAAREVLAFYKEHLPSPPLGILNYRPAVYADCQLHGQPIGLETSAAARAAQEEITELADHLLERMGN